MARSPAATGADGEISVYLWTRYEGRVLHVTTSLRASVAQRSRAASPPSSLSTTAVAQAGRDVVSAPQMARGSHQNCCSPSLGALGHPRLSSCLQGTKVQSASASQRCGDTAGQPAEPRRTSTVPPARHTCLKFKRSEI